MSCDLSHGVRRLLDDRTVGRPWRLPRNALFMRALPAPDKGVFGASRCSFAAIGGSRALRRAVSARVRRAFALPSGLVPHSPIMSLNSRGHMRSPVSFDDLNFTSRPYDPWLAYGQSKTANVLFAVKATHRWDGDRITANAVHPGAIHTNLSRHMGPDERESLRTSGVYKFKTPEQGAADRHISGSSGGERSAAASARAG